MTKTVSYARVANSDWGIFQTDDGKYVNDQVQLAVLLDIRSELRALTRIMRCPNVQAMALAMIELNKRAKAKGWPLKRKARAKSA